MLELTPLPPLGVTQYVYGPLWTDVCSPRENYFRSARQNVRQAFNALPDMEI